MLKNNFKKFFSIIPIGAISLLAPLSATSCSSNGIYLGNFQSYMSPDLIATLKDEFTNINFRYYESNENLERSFRNYDVAIPSTYLVAKLAGSGKLEKLDWASFGLTYVDENNIQHDVTNADEALNLFVPDVQKILTSIYDVNGGGIDAHEDNLLQWGVPYFLQDFVIGYKGNEITSLKSGESTWNDIMQYFAENTNPNDSKKYNKIAMIDDYRSIYSIPRLMQTSDKSKYEKEVVNPGTFENGVYVQKDKNIPEKQFGSIDTFKETYSYLASIFKEKNTFLLNPDSGEILNNFANPKGSDVGIMYNGDLIYGMLGGDEKYDVGEVHYIRPKQTLVALDMMVINKSSRHKEEAHQIINKVTLEGASWHGSQIDAGDQNIYYQEKENDEEYYVKGPMVNFDYVMYTSPLKAIYDYVENGDADGYKYFDYLIDEGYPQEFVDMCVNLFKIETKPTPENLIEKDLSELFKSNMYYAYLSTKERL